MLFLKFGVNPGTAITSLVLGEYRSDLLQQRSVRLIAFTRRPLSTFTPMVVTAFRHPQYLTKHADRELARVRLDERTPQVVCFAK